MRRNVVTVKNGKGHKKVETFNSARGKAVTRKSKTLRKSEIKNIKQGIFMPRLFKGLPGSALMKHSWMDA